MEKTTKIVIFVVIITVIIGIIVFSTGNQSSPIQKVTNTTSNQTVLNLTNTTKESTISSSELAEHNNKSDCWVSYKGSVYDVTSWLPKHPGSSGAISPYCGTSSGFEEAFTKKHGTTKANLLVQVSRFMGYFEKVGTV